MREKRGYNMNIKEVEKVTGLTKANIRFYEEEGLVCPKRNEQNNYRIYTEVEIKRLQEVKKLRLLGISIRRSRRSMRKNYHCKKQWKDV